MSTQVSRFFGDEGLLCTCSHLYPEAKQLIAQKGSLFPSMETSFASRSQQHVKHRTSSDTVVGSCEVQAMTNLRGFTVYPQVRLASSFLSFLPKSGDSPAAERSKLVCLRKSRQQKPVSMIRSFSTKNQCCNSNSLPRDTSTMLSCAARKMSPREM